MTNEKTEQFVSTIHIYDDPLELSRARKENPTYVGFTETGNHVQHTDVSDNSRKGNSSCALKKWCRICFVLFLMSAVVVVVLYCIRNEIRVSKVSRVVNSIISHKKKQGDHADVSLPLNNTYMIISSGRDGRNGIDGRNGTDGRPGNDGQRGLDGINGTNGRDGKNGKHGMNSTITIVHKINHTVTKMYPQRCAIHILQDVSTGGTGVRMRVQLAKTKVNVDAVASVACSSASAGKVYFENAPTVYVCHCIGLFSSLYTGSLVKCTMYYWLCNKTV